MRKVNLQSKRGECVWLAKVQLNNRKRRSHSRLVFSHTLTSKGWVRMACQSPAQPLETSIPLNPKEWVRSAGQRPAQQWKMSIPLTLKGWVHMSGQRLAQQQKTLIPLTPVWGVCLAKVQLNDRKRPSHSPLWGECVWLAEGQLTSGNADCALAVSQLVKS